MHRNRSGFTLIEVMVALVIFSIMTVGFSHYTGQETRQISYLTDKTLAAIVATDVIDKARMGGWPATGQSTQKMTMAKKQWDVEINVQKTASEDMERVDVSVTPMVAGDTPQEQALLTMVGFVGRH